jgi:2-polyprenyl-3-methyl-5-hydroxy-6-metoxy-1,4-benzoquinol methylase
MVHPHDPKLTMKTIVPGIPARFTDYLVERRCAILTAYPEFCGPDLDLLDFGCGNGAVMLALNNQFRTCHGLDISPVYRATFVNEAVRRGISNCTFSIEDLSAMSERQDVYDRIISFEVLEHLPDDVQAARMMYRLLSAKGMVALSVPNKWWIFETHGANLPLLPWNRMPFFSWLPTRIHERLANARIYTKARITRLVKTAGFRLLDSFYMTAPMDRVRWKLLQSCLRRTIFRSHITKWPILATSIIVIAQKGQ